MDGVPLSLCRVGAAGSFAVGQGDGRVQAFDLRALSTPTLDVVARDSGARWVQFFCDCF